MYDWAAMKEMASPENHSKGQNYVHTIFFSITFGGRERMLKIKLSHHHVQKLSLSIIFF